jgi:hypothetical protein
MIAAGSAIGLLRGLSIASAVLAAVAVIVAPLVFRAAAHKQGRPRGPGRGNVGQQLAAWASVRQHGSVSPEAGQQHVHDSDADLSEAKQLAEEGFRGPRADDKAPYHDAGGTSH